MDAAMLQEQQVTLRIDREMLAGTLVSPGEFHNLIVSHRRMVRADQRVNRLRGLQDLDTGEVFLIEERRLLDGRR
jgi:hypothetical protein